MTEMTQEERIRLIDEAGRRIAAGDTEGGEAIFKKIPMRASFLKSIKDGFGSDVLRRIGYNYSKAEELYGKDWLAH